MVDSRVRFAIAVVVVIVVIIVLLILEVPSKIQEMLESKNYVYLPGMVHTAGCGSATANPREACNKWGPCRGCWVRENGRGCMLTQRDLKYEKKELPSKGYKLYKME
jgi:hypothetical protein